MSQVRRVTPEHFFPESEILPGVVRQYVRGTDGNAIAARRTSEAEAFGTPWPLSEKYFLAVRSRHLPANSAGGARTAPKSNPVPVEPHGIYLCDIFGNRELLFRDPRHSALDPIPLAPRPRPPVIPSAVPDEFAAGSSGGSASAAAGSTGTVSIVNIYESERPFPAGVKIAAVRVVQIHPKPNFHETDPRVGIGAQSLVRSVLGTAPVEPDGSAHFECPAGVEIYFQALDADGLAVQTMRSGTYLHAGETMSCVGCHENRLNAPPPRAGTPLALRRAPSRLRPETKTGSAPVDFARLVQPVLDKHCVSCHGGSGGRGAGSGEIVRAAGKPPMKTASPAAKKSLTVKPSLRGDVFAPHGWSAAYTALTAGHATPRSWAWARCGGNGSSVRHREDSFSVPGAVGARASRLWTFLKRGHGTKNFSADDWRRVSLWLDTNSVFFGTYRPVPPVPPVVKPPPVPPVPVAVAKKP
ncbi:MAG: hypothetical protein LBR07_02275 [Puniceicoccales bacterium]|nr:hypothetical protein [Puniceicoccales bacterium]